MVIEADARRFISDSIKINQEMLNIEIKIKEIQNNDNLLEISLQKYNELK